MPPVTKVVTSSFSCRHCTRQFPWCNHCSASLLHRLHTTDIIILRLLITDHGWWPSASVLQPEFTVGLKKPSPSTKLDFIMLHYSSTRWVTVCLLRWNVDNFMSHFMSNSEIMTGTLLGSSRQSAYSGSGHQHPRPPLLANPNLFRNPNMVFESTYLSRDKDAVTWSTCDG